MSELLEFLGTFGDFETLDHDVSLSKYVFCTHGPDGDIEAYKVIVGWTRLPYDYLLHIVDVEDVGDKLGESNTDLESHIEKNGIEFVLLKDFIGKTGLELHPDFQLSTTDR